MGFLFWGRGKKSQPAPESKSGSNSDPKTNQNAAEVSGMNGALEVPRPGNITVFEFGSVATSTDRVTLAGYCPVSDELEPCRWEIIPAPGSDAPQFRVVF